MEQQQKVRDILSGAVTTLCKRLITFKSAIKVEGLLGITVDTSSVVLVNILDEVQEPCSGADVSGLPDGEDMEINAENSAFLEKLLAQPRDNENFETENWTNDIDIKVPETVLAELLDQVQTDKCDLFAVEPKKHKSKKKKKRKEVVPIKEETPFTMETTDLLAGLGGQSSKVNGKDAERSGGMTLLGCEDSPRNKNIPQSLRNFVEQDTLLSMDHDDHSLDCFPSSLTSPCNLDCNGQLGFTDSPTKSGFCEQGALNGFQSFVKEETNDPSISALSINSELGESPENSRFLPNILDTDDTASTTVGGKYPCDHCGALFSHKRSLWRHRKKHKGAESEWRCDVCSQTFSRKDILLRHKKHHKMKNQKCPFCNKVFCRLDSIQRHISISHNDKVLDTEHLGNIV